MVATHNSIADYSMSMFYSVKTWLSVKWQHTTDFCMPGLDCKMQFS